MTTPTILQDEREVLEVTVIGAWVDWKKRFSTLTGHRIVPYGEPGLHCELPFFAVYDAHSGKLLCRLPGHSCIVEYSR